MEIISAVSAGPVISEGFGKLERMGLNPITPDYLRFHLSGEPRIGDWFGF
jgi:hypothetical protein